MYIKFKSIEMEGFRSIRKAYIKLDDNGIVLIKGINNYDDNASSNGSGKSSIFEGIFYAIYGRTSNGVTDPSNRYMSSGCYVKLKFLIDTQEYTIIRSIKHDKYKTVTQILRGEDDISGRNKTDTDKIIKSDVIKISQDIFLSTIFLSQSFPGRLGILQPSGRKERLEVLTDISSKIDEFKRKMSDISKDYDNKVQETRREISYNKGSSDNMISSINEIIRKIDEASKDSNDINLDELKTSLKSFEQSYRDLTSEQYSISSKISENMSRISSLNSDILRSKSEVSKLELKISDLNSKICPTCNQHINNKETIDSLSSQYNNSIRNFSNIIKDNSEAISVIQSDIDNDNQNKVIIEKKISSMDSKIKKIRDLIEEASKRVNLEDESKRVLEIKKKLKEINLKISELEENESDYFTNYSIANHCVTLISKQFRSYLMKNTIDFVNSRLKYYSKFIFSNESDVVYLLPDASKLDIYSGDQLYETLSGGEKRKVDLVLALAQRDLSLDIAGFSCNILVLDETLENMDSVSTTAALELLIDASSFVDSMYIISHNNYDLPNDKEITIIKNQDRTSDVVQ